MLDKKIPPPLVMLLCALLIWGTTKITTPLPVSMAVKISLALPFLIAGVLIDVASLYGFRKHQTTLNPFKPESTQSLVISGTYRISRNPMYLGLALLLSAWSLYLAVPLGLLAVIGFILYITHFQIKPEERALEQAFGSQYRDYKAKVRRWL